MLRTRGKFVSPATSPLSRQVRLFDATMIVMGGIVDAGIFIKPYVVAQRVYTPALIRGWWWPIRFTNIL